LALLLIGGIFGTYAFGIAVDTRGQVPLPEVAAGAWLSSICWVELLEPAGFTPPVNPAGLALDFVVPADPPEPPMLPTEFAFAPDCGELRSPVCVPDVIELAAFA